MAAIPPRARAPLQAKLEPGNRHFTFVAALLLALAVAHGPTAHAADIALGEYLSGECSSCHRKDGRETGIPAIIGWPVDQFLAVMNAYKTNDRPNRVMQTIAGKLSDKEMEALAAYYGGLKPQ